MIDIPKGTAKEDIAARKQIIFDFYQDWKLKHPEMRMYNQSLKEYINIRYVSIDETCAHASKNYLSTLAVLQLDAILVTHEKVQYCITAMDVKKASRRMLSLLPQNAWRSFTER